MTGAEFQRLQISARHFGKCLGVAVTLRIGLSERSRRSAPSVRLIVRVFRFIPEKLPTEYWATLPCGSDIHSLNARVCSLIKIGAEALGAVHVHTDAPRADGRLPAPMWQPSDRRARTRMPTAKSRRSSGQAAPRPLQALLPMTARHSGAQWPHVLQRLAANPRFLAGDAAPPPRR
jgi:hypothetical protein